MKHLEELKIGATAILFCLIMLLVYAVFPNEGFVPSPKAPMPPLPTSDSWEEEENYGFQIYTQESNYTYHEPDTIEPDTGSTENIPEENDTPQTDASQTPSIEDTPEPEVPSEPSVPDDSYADEPSDDSFIEEPSEDTSYEDPGHEDEFDWESSEETYPPQA